MSNFVKIKPVEKAKLMQ